MQTFFLCVNASKEKSKYENKFMEREIERGKRHQSENSDPGMFEAEIGRPTEETNKTKQIQTKSLNFVIMKSDYLFISCDFVKSIWASLAS